MSAARWERLRSDLVAAGIDAKVDERPYSESVRGRVRHGVTRSITLRIEGGLVEIADTWWPRNTEVWIGWAVHRLDRDDIVVDRTRGLKNRREVVSVVRRLVGLR